MTTETAPAAERQAVPRLTFPEVWLAAVGALAAAAVGALGLYSSFDAVSLAAARWGFSNPRTLPIAIDIAIPVFTLANLLLIRLDMALGWVRFVPWVLTLVTCWLNIAAGHALSARVAHGTMPLLWVVFSEIGAHVYAVRIGAVTGRRMDKIRFSRWLLAPASTFALWRRMTLWEVTSYTDALAVERERLLSRADLHERYGVIAWRWRTPRRERVMLRMGELAPATEQETSAPPPAENPPAPPVEPKPRPRRPAPAKAKAQRTFEEALTEARTATEQWTEAELTADRLRTTLHVSQANARKLRDQLKAERDEGSPLHAVDGAVTDSRQADGTAVAA
jgi:hypothetical protein